ncbi:MAG: hypothetical protein QW153_01455 [Candidatus Bilamarchaeaceae archaeon]
MRGCFIVKELEKKLRPIINWRNPALGKFYYSKGLRRKKFKKSPDTFGKIKKPLIEDSSIFKPSKVISGKEPEKIFYPSKVISKKIDTVPIKNSKTF